MAVKSSMLIQNSNFSWNTHLQLDKSSLIARKQLSCVAYIDVWPVNFLHPVLAKYRVQYQQAEAGHCPQSPSPFEIGTMVSIIYIFSVMAYCIFYFYFLFLYLNIFNTTFDSLMPPYGLLRLWIYIYKGFVHKKKKFCCYREEYQAQLPLTLMSPVYF